MSSSSLTNKQPEWPNEALAKYEPIRELGRGGFASVILARRKSKVKNNEGNHFVAMKQVKASTSTQKNYANRELYILREIYHPNIMQLIDYWEPKGGSKNNTTITMALSYAGSRTLDFVLENFGSPSLAFSRVVTAQLVDAVSYLHSHAIIHRDIKPDNIVLKGIDDLNDTSIFDDKDTIDVSWAELRKKWHLTLVDFGFARALGPDDVGAPTEFIKPRNISQSSLSINKAVIGKITKQQSNRKNYSETYNISRHKVLDLSALGNRNYAAPEVKNRVREEENCLSSCHRGVNCTLSRFVSNYGMTADAFSVGATARYLLTGVRPEDNVEDVIANYNNPVNKLIRKIKKRRNKNSTTGVIRKKKYRSGSALPPNGLTLIKAMTQPNLQTRMSVRDARLCPYVDEVLENHNFTKNLVFLSFVKDSEQKE